MKRLLRLTALALGLTLLLSACGHKNTEPERKDAATQTVPVEGITGLTLCDGDVTLRFEKDEAGNWIWHDDPAFPLEQSAMDELLALPAALDGGETVTDGQELSVYGLETPAKYITVTADGEDATYYVGEETTDGRWYVLTPDGLVLYASAESKALLSRSIYDMAVLPQLPVIAPEQVVSVTILTPERTVAFLADEDGVRCGQVGQNLRGGPLDQGQIIGVEFLPVLADEGTGVGGAFHRVDMPARCGQRQFDADASGPGPDIPKGIRRPDSQLRQCGGADFLLRHGDLSPDEGIIREAGGPPGRENGVLDEQNAQRGTGVCGKGLRRAE